MEDETKGCYVRWVTGGREETDREEENNRLRNEMRTWWKTSVALLYVVFFVSIELQFTLIARLAINVTLWVRGEGQNHMRK